MKVLPWAITVAVLLAAFFLRPHPVEDSRLAIAQAQLAELLIDSAHHATVIRELEDSLAARLRESHRGQDETRRRVPVDSTRAMLADSLARAATTMAELRIAYDSLHVAFDSAQRTASIAQQATNDALAALAFSRLQRIADSTRIAKFEQAAPVVLAASKKSWWTNRINLYVGYGATKTNLYVVAGPQVAVGLRVWPWS